MNLKQFLFCSTALLTGLFCSHDSLWAAGQKQGKNAPTAKESIRQAPSRTVNLKQRESQIIAFYAQITKAGKEKELSQEFKTIYMGMQKGTYEFDREVVKKGMQDFAKLARTLRFHSKKT